MKVNSSQPMYESNNFSVDSNAIQRKERDFDTLMLMGKKIAIDFFFWRFIAKSHID